MNNSSAAYNRHIMNKMLWMSRKLRNFNDTVSISNWAHTMSILKNLLLPPLPPAPQNIPRPSPTQVNIPEPVRSITPPHTICFQPAIKKPLTQSAPRCTINNNSKPSSLTLLTQSAPRCIINNHSKPSPLTTYTLCLPNIASTDSLPQRPKRRKLSIPPSVDYYYSTETPLPTSTAAATSPTTTTPGLGAHLWYLRDPKTSDALWSSTKTSGAIEFRVVKTPRDFDSKYELRNISTGKDFGTTFTEDVATQLFKT